MKNPLKINKINFVFLFFFFFTILTQISLCETKWNFIRVITSFFFIKKRTLRRRKALYYSYLSLLLVNFSLSPISSSLTMSKSNGEEEDSLPPNHRTNATPNSKPPSSSSDGLDRSSSFSSSISDPDYVCRSFFGAYPNRSRVHIRPRNDISNRDSDSETDKLLVIGQIVARRIRRFNHSLVLYLVS